MRTLVFCLVVLTTVSGLPVELRACEPGCPQRLDVTFRDLDSRDVPRRIPYPEVRRLEIVNVRLTAAQLDELLSDTWVECVSIEGGAVGDDVCAVLAGHASLVEVRLVGTRVTDAGLAMLARLERLRVVDLRGTRVTRAGLAAFLATSPARLVDVRGTAVEDDSRTLVTGDEPLRLLLDAPAAHTSRVVSNGSH